MKVTLMFTLCSKIAPQVDDPTLKKNLVIWHILKATNDKKFTNELAMFKSLGTQKP